MRCVAPWREDSRTSKGGGDAKRRFGRGSVSLAVCPAAPRAVCSYATETPLQPSRREFDYHLLAFLARALAAA